ncbi:hypothetical protein [Photobacterium damselae]|uniref:hypothetical protein n=2 Tax=Photobacterium damselae TaxID=38293 RepID=UPI000D65F1D9|nr:hypothetical protein [Photobacterium damselae]AWK84638.1 hypothetical protein BST98_21665 [Photobacterium damselae]MCG3826493.1 hypothetical protein [Photobacterium damselae]
MLKRLQVIITSDSQYAISDFDVENWYQALLLESSNVAHVATGLMLNELRIGVRLCELEPFSFEFRGETVNCLKNGELDKWPNGLFDHAIVQMDVLMQGITREQARKNI